VLDDFERALKAAETATEVAPVKEGMALIQHKLLKNLEQKGLKAVEPKGEAFDVEYHEAITEIPAPTEDLKGKVVDVVEKGYYLNDRIIRYAKVVVGK
jgi:molecular chaperone GrpE